MKCECDSYDKPCDEYDPPRGLYADDARVGVCGSCGHVNKCHTLSDGAARPERD